MEMIAGRYANNLIPPAQCQLNSTAKYSQRKVKVIHIQLSNGILDPGFVQQICLKVNDNFHIAENTLPGAMKDEGLRKRRQNQITPIPKGRRFL
jgi:hypothetical protein